MRVLFLLLFIFSCGNSLADNRIMFKSSLKQLEESLKKEEYIKSREYLRLMESDHLNNDEWLLTRDLIHRYPKIGYDELYRFEQSSPFKLNKIDSAIIYADSLLSKKEFAEAISKYQEILKYITTRKNFEKGRNIKLYWSLVHSLARSLYGNKQFEDSTTVYKIIPSSYPYFRQAQYELAWSSFLANRLDITLGAIATISFSEFSKVFNPEIYLIQYYALKKICRYQDAELLKQKVKLYYQSINTVDYKLGSWLKRDINTIILRDVLLSGKVSNDETIKLKSELEKEKKEDIEIQNQEFKFINAHLSLISKDNKYLNPINNNSGSGLNNSYFSIDVGRDFEYADLGSLQYINGDACKK